jgi:hypothetical protein
VALGLSACDPVPAYLTLRTHALPPARPRAHPESLLALILHQPSTTSGPRPVTTIAFLEMPALGHVNPSLPLARELSHRAHRVIYYNDAEFQSVVAPTGTSFRPYPPRTVTSAAIAQATQTGDLLHVPRVIIRATHTLVPFLLDQLQRDLPDVVVLDSNALWGHIVARRQGPPTVSLFTTIVLGTDDSRQLRPREWLHMLKPVLPSIHPIMAARTRLLRAFGPHVPRPAFPATGD